MRKDEAKSRLLLKLFGKLEIDEKRGLITVSGVRMFITPAAFVPSIKERLTDEFGSAIAYAFIYEMGRQVGRDILQLTRRTGFKLPTESNEFPLNKSLPNSVLGIFDGSGTTEVKEVDFKRKFMRARWRDGIAIETHRGRIPVCHFTRGSLAGACQELFGVKCEALETYCQGKGDKFCEAVIGRPKDIAKIAEGLAA